MLSDGIPIQQNNCVELADWIDQATCRCNNGCKRLDLDGFATNSPHHDHPKDSGIQPLPLSPPRPPPGAQSGWEQVLYCVLALGLELFVNDFVFLQGLSPNLRSFLSIGSSWCFFAHIAFGSTFFTFSSYFGPMVAAQFHSTDTPTLQ